MSSQTATGFFHIIRRELSQIAERPGLAFMLGPFPLLAMLLLAVVFAPGVPTNLPVAVVDQDGTSLSRQVVRMVDATSDVDVAKRVPTLAEGKDALISGEVYAVILIPDNMERDLLAGRSPELVTLYNNQLLSIGGIVARASTRAIGTFGSAVSAQILLSNGTLREDALNEIVPVPVQQNPLFNPALDYVQFLLSALGPAVIQIFITASAALSLSREAQREGGFREMLALGGSPLRSLLGKLAPYAFAYFVTLLAADAVLFGVFDMPFNGNFTLHLLNTFMFVCSCLCLGGFFGVLAGETIGALGFTGIVTGPAFGFSGISFPRITMNGFSWVWGALLPLTPYLQLRTDQVLRGAPIDISLPTLGWLSAQAVIYGLLLWGLVLLSGKRAEEVSS